MDHTLGQTTKKHQPKGLLKYSMTQHQIYTSQRLWSYHQALKKVKTTPSAMDRPLLSKPTPTKRGLAMPHEPIVSPHKPKATSPYPHFTNLQNPIYNTTSYPWPKVVTTSPEKYVIIIRNQKRPSLSQEQTLHCRLSPRI